MGYSMRKNKTYNKKKIVIVFFLCVLMLLGLMGRLVYLMVFRSDYYSEKADELHERERDIKAARGKILDANGTVLAANRTVCTISVIHSQIEEPEAVISMLAKELEMDEETVRERVEKLSSIERIRTNVDKETGDRIRSYGYAGVKVDEDFKRYYPYDELASKVLGFTGSDNQGIIGLEVKYEEVLKGIDGKILTTTDARGIELDGIGESRVEPVPGYDLKISLDANIQEYCQQAAEKAMEEKAGLLKNLETAEDLKLIPLSYRSELLASFEAVSPIFHGRPVCEPVSFAVNRGDRIVLDGRNGSGKSSLLKLLLEEVSERGTLLSQTVSGLPSKEKVQGLEHTGRILVGSGLIVSYVSQDTSFLKGSLSEFAEKSGIDETLLKAVLRKLDFGREQFEKGMENFSGGQKKKVLIARSLCEQAHLYVWDEPLNFIDIYSRMQIERLILEMRPTLLLVEHDRAFRDAAAGKTVRMEPAAKRETVD